MKKIFPLLCCAMMLLAACGANSAQPDRSIRSSQPSALPPTETLMSLPSPSGTPAPTDLPTLTPTATFGVGSPLTLARDAVCRMGPGESYYDALHYFQKDVVELNGRNETGDWVMVKNPFNADDPICWIPAAALTSTDGLDGVQVAEYPGLPAAPASISAPNSVCGVASRPLVVKWSPVASGAEYRVYRNGVLVSTQSGGSYQDFDLPKPHSRPVVYAYVVQTFNDYGNSPRTLSVAVSICGK